MLQMARGDALRTAFGGAVRFYRWWIDELKSLVPPLPTAVRRWLPRQQMLLLDASANHLAFGWQAGTLYTAIGQLPPARTVGAAPVGLRLPLSVAWRRTLVLPLQAQQALRPILENLLEVETPFRRDEVVFGHRVVASTVPAAELQVEIAVVRRDVVERSLMQARDAGLAPGLVGVSPAGEWPPQFELPEFKVSARRAIPRWVNAALLGLAVALIALGIYLELARRGAALTALRGELATAQERAGQVSTLREQMEGTVRQINGLIARKQQTPAIELLAEVTRLLPDSSWLVELRVQGESGILVGYAASASGLIETLSRSGVIANPRFRSPVTQGPRTDLERFDIAFDVKGSAK